MNAPLTVRHEATVCKSAQPKASNAMPKQPKARMAEAPKVAEATPRYDFVGIAG